MPLAALPNLLSGMRMVLVVPFAFALVEHAFATALSVFVIAALTDGLDGWLARRFDWQSRLGALLDPAADKLLLATSLLLLSWLGLLPLWVAAIALARDAVIVLGALAYRLRFGRVDWGARWWGKFSTAAQLVLVLLVLIGAAIPLLAPHLASSIALLGVLVAALAAISGVDYVVSWSRRARAAARSGSDDSADRPGTSAP